jgi:hypothetical protein
MINVLTNDWASMKEGLVVGVDSDQRGERGRTNVPQTAERFAEVE